MRFHAYIHDSHATTMSSVHGSLEKLEDEKGLLGELKAHSAPVAAGMVAMLF